jgi:hypothetical protein
MTKFQRTTEWLIPALIIFFIGVVPGFLVAQQPDIEWRKRVNNELARGDVE